MEAAVTPPLHRTWPWQSVRLTAIGVAAVVLWRAPLDSGAFADFGLPIPFPLSHAILFAAIALALAVIGAVMGYATDRRSPRGSTWWLPFVFCGGALCLDAILVVQFLFYINQPIVILIP